MLILPFLSALSLFQHVTSQAIAANCRIPGYICFEGDCTNFELQPPKKVPNINLCAAICRAVIECEGFSFSDRYSVCILRSSICETPAPNARLDFKFYAKKRKQTKSSLSDDIETKQRPGIGAGGLEFSIPVPGFKILNGNCPSNEIPPISSAQPPECGRMCLDNRRCQGFAHSKTSNVCILKSKDCDKPVPSSNFVFYRRRDVMTRKRLRRNIFTILGGPLPPFWFSGANSTATSPIDVDSGNETDSAVVEVGEGTGGGSDTSTTGSGGGASGEPKPDGRPGLKGFSRLDGDCDTAQLRPPFQSSFRDCAEACQQTTECAGFSYHLYRYTCVLRRVACLNAIPNSDQNFYLKAGPDGREVNCQSNNLGTEFLMVFMANRASQPQNMDLEIFITHNNPRQIDVTVSSKNGVRDRIKVEPNQIERVTVPASFKMTDLTGGGIVKESKNILLEGTGPMAVYGVNKEYFTADAFTALPVRSLGQKYFAACHFPPYFLCEFSVAATADNTDVQITLPRNGATDTQPGLSRSIARDCNVVLGNGERYTNGNTFTIRLNKWEAIQIQDQCDLTGTQILSNKPISVFSGNLRTNVGEGTNTRDHLVEQLTPVTAWGTECVATASPKRSVGDFWIVTAAQDQTKVQIRNTYVESRTLYLDAGYSYRFKTEPKLPVHVMADKPIMVIQYVHSQTSPAEPADPSMTLCTPSEQFGFSYTFATPTGVGTTYQNYLTLVVEKGMERQLLLDGEILRTGNPWIDVPSSTKITSYVEIQHGSHSVTHPNPKVTFGAYIYGSGTTESYGFPTGTCLKEISCAESFHVINDGKDNDCDGTWDEEMCGDLIDNDQDGRLDEDCFAERAPETLENICISGRSEGQEFIMMFMENQADPPGDIPLELYITTAPEVKDLVTVNITTPLFDPRFLELPSISPKEIVSVNVPSSLRHQGTVKSNKAVYVRATHDVVVYGINRERFTSGGFLVYPVSTLGTEYYTVCWYPSTSGCLIGLVALQDNTNIEVKFPQLRDPASQLPINVDGVTNGQTLKITLNKYETYQISSKADLTATSIRSNVKIGVFSGNVKTSIVYTGSSESRDHVVEMMPPVTSWGKVFNTISVPGRTVGDIFIAIARESKTSVRASGLPDFELNFPGDFRQFEMGSDFCGRVEADGPLLLVQFVKSQRSPDDTEVADPSMAIVPAIEQYDIRYSITTTDYAGRTNSPETGYRNYLMIAIEQRQAIGLQLNGEALPNNPAWRQISGTDYVCASVEINSKVNHIVQHTLGNIPFYGALYGNGNRESYMFPIGIRLHQQRRRCQSCPQNSACDGIDNDCDGKVEEEVCDGLDNDGDGNVDEDCCGSPQQCGIQTSEGTDFVVMFMQNKPDQPQNLPLEIYVSTNYALGQVEVEVSAPKVRGFTPITKFVRANDVTLFHLPSTMKMTKTGVEGKAIRIRAINPVTIVENKNGSNATNVTAKADDGKVPLVVYGINKESYTNDGFLALPTVTLGIDHYIAVWNPATIGGQFGIAAIQEATNVTITLADPLQPIYIQYRGFQFTNGETIQVTLNRFESFLGVNENKNSDLTGTRIKSDKPVAVFSGNIRTSIEFTEGNPSRDHLVEQIPPTEVWGKKFFTVSTPGRTVGDYYKIVASRSNTLITVNTEERSDTYELAKAGDFKQIRIRSGSCSFIESNQPVLVIMFVLSQDGYSNPEQADPSMIMIPPTNQYKLRYTFSTTDYAGLTPGSGYTNYIMIVVEKDKYNGLLLDNNPVRMGNIVNVANTNFVCGTITVQPGRHTLRHSNMITPFMGIIYGAGDRESYAFPIGMELKTQQKCFPCDQIERCDNIDNDCDGRTEEEVCDGADDDGDGLVDEDCCAEPIDKPISLQCREVFTSQACHGTYANLTCNSAQKIKVLSAHFGRVGYVGEYSCKTSNPLDCNGVEQNCGFKDILNIFESRCSGQAKCSIPINQYSLGEDCTDSPCQLCQQYGLVQYACVDEVDMSCSVLASRQTSSDPARWTASSSISSPTVAPACLNSGDGGIQSSFQTGSGTCARGGTCSQSFNQQRKPDLTMPAAARFSTSNMHSWCPSFCDRNNSYIQMDLGGHYQVTGYLVQGRRYREHWVSMVGFSYSSDGTKWVDVGTKDNLQPFKANVDSQTIQWCSLRDQDITARYVRAIVLNYNEYPCMHFDVSRCDNVQGCPALQIKNSNMESGEPGVRGSAVYVRCNQGWMSQTRQREWLIECRHDGQWSGAVNRHCDVARDCGDIPLLRDALHNGRNTRLGSMVKYQCFNGRRLEGTDTITCQDDGTWSQVPSCI